MNTKKTCVYGRYIGLRAQNMLTIMSSIINMIREDLYDNLMSTQIFTSITNKIFI